MASFSDDEKFEIEAILEQRKRKGILHYLVQWREGESTWEPAERIAADCAVAIENFMKNQKSKSKRTTSTSRKSSRSRSRSQSRSRKRTTQAVRKSSRSRSRGRQTEAAPKQSPVKEEEKKDTRRSLEKKETSTETKTEVALERRSIRRLVSSSSTPSAAAAVKPASSQASNSTSKSESDSGQILRSSTMETRQELEVQRVHNEQRPVREDDSRPRSAIWKVADYAVIVLFIVSLIAAIFMFLEKFMDLEKFKDQAFPSLETLTLRLGAAKDHTVDFFRFGWDQTSDAWDYILEQVRQPQKEQPVPVK